MATATGLTGIADLQPLHEGLRALRHQIHQQPELAFEEHATAALVASRLKEWGYEVSTGIGRTGVVGSLRLGTGTRSIGIRADMDALPIKEETGLPYASRVDGLMHACGHDGHTAMLLGAAQHLAATRRFDGTLHLIFQPAENAGSTAAPKPWWRWLIRAISLRLCVCYTQPPRRRAGPHAFQRRSISGGGDRVIVKIKSIGGHAARPHLAADPLVAAAAIVIGLQTVVSRNIDPDEAAVVTVGTLQAGQALNVIPDFADMGISVRSFSPEVRTRLKNRITTMIDATAAAHGVVAEINYVEGYPVLVNDPAAILLALQQQRACCLRHTLRLMPSD